jgi:hypothetical protein
MDWLKRKNEVSENPIESLLRRALQEGADTEMLEYFVAPPGVSVFQRSFYFIPAWQHANPLPKNVIGQIFCIQVLEDEALAPNIIELRSKDGQRVYTATMNSDEST